MSTATATPAARPRPSQGVRTLPAAARVFLRHASPWLLLAGTAATVVGRLAFGGWRWWDLGVVALVLAVQPFSEWLIHVHVLHAKPRRVGWFTVDLYQARKHRAHHADPRNLDILFIPLRAHLTGTLVVAAVAAAFPTWGLRLTLAAAVTTSALVYEWVHFLVHTDYKPRTALYRRLYVGHRLHHYRNENYWFGVSRRFGDTVLGTNPAKDEVPLSPTCMALLGG